MSSQIAAPLDPSISDDGRYVAFSSYAKYWRTGTPIPAEISLSKICRTGDATLVSDTSPAVVRLPAAALPTRPSISGDGSYVGIHRPTDCWEVIEGCSGVFVRTRQRLADNRGRDAETPSRKIAARVLWLARLLRAIPMATL